MPLTKINTEGDHTIEINTEGDIVAARTMAREVAGELGFSMMDKTRIATAVSELARNTHVHGGGGHMALSIVSKDGRTGIRCEFADGGPGIADVSGAMADGFSTINSMGQGLPGAKRLVDDFQIESEINEGTRVEIVKWK